VGVWVCGCVGVWVCGCVGVWVCGCGCVGVRVWVWVCVSAIEIQTTGLSLVKFGTGIFLKGGKVLSWDSTPYPNPQGQGGFNGVWRAHSASTVQLGEKCTEQKLQIKIYLVTLF
jgi:hypothetical protein